MLLGVILFCLKAAFVTLIFFLLEKHLDVHGGTLYILLTFFCYAQSGYAGLNIETVCVHHFLMGFFSVSSANGDIFSPKLQVHLRFFSPKCTQAFLLLTAATVQVIPGSVSIFLLLSTLMVP